MARRAPASGPLSNSTRTSTGLLCVAGTRTEAPQNVPQAKPVVPASKCLPPSPQQCDLAAATATLITALRVVTALIGAAVGPFDLQPLAGVQRRPRIECLPRRHPATLVEVRVKSELADRVRSERSVTVEAVPAVALAGVVGEDVAPRQAASVVLQRQAS